MACQPHCFIAYVTQNFLVKASHKLLESIHIDHTIQAVKKEGNAHVSKPSRKTEQPSNWLSAHMSDARWAELGTCRAVFSSCHHHEMVHQPTPRRFRLWIRPALARSRQLGQNVPL